MSLQSEYVQMQQALNGASDNKINLQDAFGGGSKVLDDGILTGAYPQHKSSRVPFLGWVAFERHFRTDADTRRKCPLVGCEYPFDTTDQMQEHLIGCLQRSSSLYRCYKCGQEEKIGKYHTNGCRNVGNYGGPLATVRNSIRSVKRRLTPRHHPATKHGMEDMQGKNHHAELGTTMHVAKPSQPQKHTFGMEVCGELTGSSPRSGVSHAELSGANWVSELPSPSNDFDHVGDHASPSAANPSKMNKADVELEKKPACQQSQFWQKPQYPPVYRLEPTRNVSMHPIEHLISPCSPTSPTGTHGWQCATPISPFGNENTHSEFSQIGRPQLRRNPSGDPDIYSLLPDRGFSPFTMPPDNVSWNDILTCAPPAVNHGSQDVPGLSDDNESRNHSASSGAETLPSQGYWNEPDPPMILQDAQMYDEPESYDDYVPELKRYKRPGKLATTEQNCTLFLEQHVQHCDLVPRSQWRNTGQSEPFRGSSGMNSFLTQHARASWPTNAASSNVEPPRRSASRRLNHQTKCPCGFEPKGIQKNRRGNLKRHMRGCRHLRQQAHPDSSPDPKPWVCDFPNCGKRFSRGDNRGQHQKSVHGYASSSASPIAIRDLEAGGFEDFGNFQGQGGSRYLR